MFNDYFAAGSRGEAGSHQRRAAEEAEVRRRRRSGRNRPASKYMPCYDPSTGAVIALAPQCTAGEVEEAIQAAANAFPGWRDTPVSKRVQVLFRMKALLDSISTS